MHYTITTNDGWTTHTDSLASIQIYTYLENYDFSRQQKVDLCGIILTALKCDILQNKSVKEITSLAAKYFDNENKRLNYSMTPEDYNAIYSYLLNSECHGEGV